MELNFNFVYIISAILIIFIIGLGIRFVCCVGTPLLKNELNESIELNEIKIENKSTDMQAIETISIPLENKENFI